MVESCRIQSLHRDLGPGITSFMAEVPEAFEIRDTPRKTTCHSHNGNGHRWLHFSFRVSCLVGEVTIDPIRIVTVRASCPVRETTIDPIRIITVRISCPVREMTTDPIRIVTVDYHSSFFHHNDQERVLVKPGIRNTSFRVTRP